jgi:hypothetical protein
MKKLMLFIAIVGLTFLSSCAWLAPAADYVTDNVHVTIGDGDGEPIDSITVHSKHLQIEFDKRTCMKGDTANGVRPYYEYSIIYGGYDVWYQEIGNRVVLRFQRGDTTLLIYEK